MTRNENTLDAGGDRIEGAEQTKPSTPIVAQTTSDAQPPRSNGTERKALLAEAIKAVKAAPVNTGDLDTLPAGIRDLATFDQWLTYKLVDKGQVRKDGSPKWSKQPLNPQTGVVSSVTSPSTWTDYHTAVEGRRRGHGHGLGFSFNPAANGIVGFDLDNCFQSDGSLAPVAVKVVQLLNSYTEVSPSGRGLHVLCRGTFEETVEADRMKKVTVDGVDLELYQVGRFFTVTGDHVEGLTDTIEDRTAELATLVCRYFTEAPKPTRTTRTSEAGSPPPLTDAEIIDLARTAKNGDKFTRLYAGDWSGYPSESEADGALACLIAFYTKDPAQIERIMRGSKLARDKWDRPDYLPKDTIPTALGKVTESYTPPAAKTRRKKDTPPNVDPDTGEVLGGTGSRIPKEAMAPDGFTLSEAGNAERFAARHADGVLYTDATGWLVWDGCRYSQTSDEVVLNMILETNRELYDQVRENEDRMRFIRQVLTFEKTNSRRGSETTARGLAALRTTADTLDVDRYLINFTNGTFNVRTGEPRPHRREDKITRLVPCDYNPTARCPVWIDALHGIFALDPEPAASVAGLQRLLGYAITGDTCERVIAFFVGTGRNGKSTVLETLAAVLGPDYVQAAKADVLMAGGVRRGGATPDLAALRGVRLVTLSETEAEGRLNSNLVKALTGGDTVSARELYKDPMNFKPEFTPILATNHRPVIGGRDVALFDRLVYVPFERRFVLEAEDPNAKPADLADPRLKEKLEAEREGIAAWLVEGAVAWYREIAAGRSTGLLNPPHWRDAKAEYQDTEDSVGQFVTEACVSDPREKATTADLYKAYSTFCEDVGTTPVERRVFGKTLSEMGYRPGKSHGKRYVQGIRPRDTLLDEAGDEEPEYVYTDDGRKWEVL